MNAVGFVVIAALATLGRVLLTASPGADPQRFPWPTLMVNTTGAAALGVITGSDWWHDPVVITSAGLGSLTTFSTVISETFRLWEHHRPGRAVLYLAATVVLAVCAARIGLELA